MAGPGGREVGRIAIRVLPDTSKFSTSLQSYLDRIERRAQVKVKVTPDFAGFTADMRAELSRVRARIEVPVTPNTGNFADRVRSELAGVQARIEVKVTPDFSRFATAMRTDLSGVRARLEVPVTPNMDGFAARVGSDLSRVEDRSRVRVPVLPDTREFSARLRAEITSLIRPVTVPVEPDVSRFQQRVYSQLRGPLRQTRLLVGLLPNVSEFRVRLERQLRAIRATLPVLVTPNFAGFRRALRRELGDIDIELPVVLAVVDGEIARLRAELRAIRPPLSVPVRFDADRSALDRLQSSLGSLGSIGGRLAMITALVGGLVVALGNAVPAVAALVAQLAQIAPAAAVGATAIVSIITATAALKIGTKGVGEALKNAFDPDSAEAFAEALKKLTPNARKFVLAIQKLGPEFSKLRKAVQEQLFENFGKQITATAKAALPVLRRGLKDTAGSLNRMGQGVLSTARDLARSGTLGKAIDGANKGLSNLEEIPGRFVKGLLEISVAASPAFDRLTKAADRASKRMSDRITRGLKSGSIERAIDNAIKKLKQLGRVGRNIGDILGNVFGPAAEVGGDFLSILEDITGELAKVTGTKGAQSAFKAVFETLNEVGQSFGRLLGEALKAIGPALQELAGPLRTVVRNLEDGLRPVIQALGPLLATLGRAIGGVARELSPFLKVIGELVGGVLKAAQPVFDAIGDQLIEIARVLKNLLLPAWQGLQPVLQPLLETLGKLLGTFMSIGTQILKELQPAFKEIGKAFGAVWRELQPLAIEFQKLIDEILPKLKPIVTPIIKAIGELAAIFAKGLARVMTDIVLPALRTLVALLQGDYAKAWAQAKITTAGAAEFIVDVVKKLPGLVGEILKRLVIVVVAEMGKARDGIDRRAQEAVLRAVLAFAKLPGKARAALADLGWQMSSKARQELAELLAAINRRVGEAVDRIASLPVRAAGALRGIGSYLYGAGVQLVMGLISGIMSRASSVADSARRVVSNAIGAAKDALGINSPSRVFMEIGEQTGQGLVVGIAGMRRDVAGAMTGLVDVPSMRLSTMANLSTVAAADAGAVFEGALYLDSGELLGVVHGVMNQRDQQLVSTLRAGRRG